MLYYISFGSCLVFFHALQSISFFTIGYRAQKFSVDILNFMILKCLNLLGTKIEFNHLHKLPLNRSLIFVANHQSTYDVPPIIWHLRKHHIKFVSKKELGKGIPSVSFNLRHGGSVLIDRDKPKQAIELVRNFGKQLSEKNHSAMIFPEGTRSKDGVPKHFQKTGLLILIECMPNALIVPVSIENSWKMAKHKYFPIPLGVRLNFKVHKAMEIKSEKHHLLLERVEAIIKKELLKKEHY
jgi:1-acyl-sn-glycerol-3-phosphate acyltransferase